jgi:hypothetical protein
MRWIALCLLLFQESLGEAEFARIHRDLQLPKSGMWGIPWKISVHEARKLAAETGRPLFIWAQDGNPMGST